MSDTQHVPNPSQLPELTPTDVPATMYLNERLVLDMLAAVQDGFVRTVRVDRVSSGSGTSEAEASAGIGGTVMSLIGVNLGGKLREGSERADAHSESGERTHTLASLFSRLRADLRSRSFVKEVSESRDLTEVVTGDFVEATVRIQRNGLIEVVRSIRTFFELAESMPGINRSASASQNKSVGPKDSNHLVKKQMDWILARARPGKFEDLVGTTLAASPVSFVMPVDGALFMDSTMREVLNADCRVFGKVTRVVSNSNDAALNLLRGTDLGTMAAAVWNDIVSSISTNALQASLNLPREIVMSVRAPAIQLIPVALFV